MPWLAALCKCGGDLPQDIERQAGRERAAAANDFAQIAAGHVFLGDVVDAVLLADFVDLHDAGVHQRGGGPGFVMEAADVVRIARQVGVEHLERDLPAERKLLGQIDFGHRPAAEPAQHVEVLQFFADQIGHAKLSSTAKLVYTIVCWRAVVRLVQAEMASSASDSRRLQLRRIRRSMPTVTVGGPWRRPPAHRPRFGAVQHVEVDSGHAGVEKCLRLAGGKVDADGELRVGILADRFEAADHFGRQLCAATAT